MLKGLKLKTKLPDKSSESSTQPSQPSRIEEENNTSSRSNSTIFSVISINLYQKDG